MKDRIISCILVLCFMMAAVPLGALAESEVLFDIDFTAGDTVKSPITNSAGSVYENIPGTSTRALKLSPGGGTVTLGYNEPDTADKSLNKTVVLNMEITPNDNDSSWPIQIFGNGGNDTLFTFAGGNFTVPGSEAKEYTAGHTYSVNVAMSMRKSNFIVTVWDVTDAQAPEEFFSNASAARAFSQVKYNSMYRYKMEASGTGDIYVSKLQSYIEEEKQITITAEHPSAPYFRTGDDITINALATGGVPVKLELIQDGVSVDTKTAAPWTFTVKNLKQGETRLAVKAYYSDAGTLESNYIDINAVRYQYSEEKPYISKNFDNGAAAAELGIAQEQIVERTDGNKWAKLQPVENADSAINYTLTEQTNVSPFMVELDAKFTPDKAAAAFAVRYNGGSGSEEKIFFTVSEGKFNFCTDEKIDCDGDTVYHIALMLSTDTDKAALCITKEDGTPVYSADEIGIANVDVTKIVRVKIQQNRVSESDTTAVAYIDNFTAGRLEESLPSVIINAYSTLLPPYVAGDDILVTVRPGNSEGIGSVELYNGTECLETKDTAPYDFQMAKVQSGTLNLLAKIYYNDSTVLESDIKTINVETYYPINSCNTDFNNHSLPEGMSGIIAADSVFEEMGVGDYALKIEAGKNMCYEWKTQYKNLPAQDDRIFIETDILFSALEGAATTVEWRYSDAGNYDNTLLYFNQNGVFTVMGGGDLTVSYDAEEVCHIAMTVDLGRGVYHLSVSQKGKNIYCGQNLKMANIPKGFDALRLKVQQSDLTESYTLLDNLRVAILGTAPQPDFIVSDLSYRINDMQAESIVSAAVGDSVKAQAKVISNVERTQSCTAILAIYDKDGKLVDCSVNTGVSIEPGENIVTVAATAACDYDDTYISKMFLWDSFSDMRPMTEPK